MHLLKRYPVPAYFVLAYVLSWACMGTAAWLSSSNGIIAWIGGFMPAVSAVIVLAITEGRAGLKQMLGRLLAWRVGFRWYLVALLSPLALVLMALPFHSWLGGRVLPDLGASFWTQSLPSIGILLVMICTFGVFMSAGEEIGWRGYALPRLQARFGPWWATLILGVLWGIWHLPLFLIPGAAQYGMSFPGFVLASVGYSVIYTCLINRGRGSVLLASLFHSSGNGTVTYAAAIFPFLVQDVYLSLPALAIVALIVVLISGYLTTARGFNHSGTETQRF